LRLKKKRSYFNTMKKFLVLLTVLGLLATPAMAASTHLEKKNASHHKQRARHQTKHQKKHANKKVAKHNTRKHKVAV
jgi:Ni/Co efflux regulator RcnB